MNDPNTRAPRLLERYREEMLVRRYASRTITSYVSWVRRYLRFHHLRGSAPPSGVTQEVL
jgi:hypothetical protein